MSSTIDLTLPVFELIYQFLGHSFLGCFVFLLFCSFTGGGVRWVTTPPQQKHAIMVTFPCWWSYMVALAHAPVVSLLLCLHSVYRQCAWMFNVKQKHHVSTTTTAPQTTTSILAKHAKKEEIRESLLNQPNMGSGWGLMPKWNGDELHDLFHSLDPVNTEDYRLLFQNRGLFRGEMVPSTLGFIHLLCWPWTLQNRIGIAWGKQFQSAYGVEPAMFTFFQRLLVSWPVLGAASLHQLPYGGKTSATMVYNQVPMHDHFRWLDESKTAMLGLMLLNGEHSGFFVLYKA